MSKHEILFLKLLLSAFTLLYVCNIAYSQKKSHRTTWPQSCELWRFNRFRIARASELKLFCKI